MTQRAGDLVAGMLPGMSLAFIISALVAHSSILGWVAIAVSVVSVFLGRLRECLR